MAWRRPVLLLLLAACGDRTPIPGEDGVRITTGADPVALGQVFPLTVVRVWSKSDAPRPWNDEVLAPLALRHLETTRREDGRRVEETRRYDAYAFSLEDVTAFDNRLRIERALDPKAPGAAELPPTLEPAFPWFWPVAGFAAFALALFLYRRRRPAEQPVAPPPPLPDAPGPEVRALERLAKLRSASLDTQPFYVEATALLREYIGARFDVPAKNMTTEEMAAAGPTPRDTFLHCDLVKFGRGAPERDATLDGIERFILETT